MDQFNQLTQQASTLKDSSMGVIGELTKLASSISNFQGDQQKNIIDLFKLVADIQNPTIPMDERFQKIHASIDKIQDSYKATQQLITAPPATPETPAAPPATPPASGGNRRKSRRNKRNKRKTRK